MDGPLGFKENHTKEPLKNMSSANASSEPCTATTSPTGPPFPASKSEADYLALQAADAKAAFTHTANELGRDLKQVANEHPLLALSTAAVAGALAARLIA